MDFGELTGVFEKLEGTTKRLELADDLAKLFSQASKEDLRVLAYLCQGILLPEHSGVELGMGDKLCEQAIALATGSPQNEVVALYRKTGDLGEAAEKLLEKKSQRTLARTGLSVRKAYDNFYKIATASGAGSQQQKIRLLAELLNNASPGEAKVTVRFVTGRLRLGIGAPTILDALSVARAGDKSLRNDLERAFNLRNDLGLVTELFMAEKDAGKAIAEIRKIGPQVFSPIRPALAERLESGAAIIEKLGECAVEAKLDGFRLQVHKKGSEVKIFSRRQEPMAHMFPDLVEAVRRQVKAREAVFEGEAIAFNEATGEFLPFQTTMQRKRKHGVEEKSRQLPLKLFAFELLYEDGRDYTQLPYRERRKLLEKIVSKGSLIEPAKLVFCSTAKQLEEFFDECVSSGLEGIIAKDLSAPYAAGARKFAWIKLKRSYSSHLADTIDAVVTGYYLGKGKRAEFGFGGLLTAVYDAEENRFRSIAKVGTGFTEKEMGEFKKMLEKIKVKERPANVESVLEPDVWVQPAVVVTLTADEITRSPVHACAVGKLKGHEKEGLALRFPRLTQLREDKSPGDATTEEEIIEMYELQGRGGKKEGKSKDAE